jgi:hypothetical protein
MHNKKIGKQEAQIEFLIHTIQQLNSNMNHKFERMLHLITHKTLEEPMHKDTCTEIRQEDSVNNNNITIKQESTSQAPKKQKVGPSSNRRHRQFPA